MSYKPSTSPISWASARYIHCLERIRPTSHRGMFVNLTRNLSPKLRDPRDRGWQRKNESLRESGKYDAYIKVLERQQQVQKTFTGQLYVTDAHVARNVGDRLHRAMNLYQPAESRVQVKRRPTNENYLLSKPVYTRAEIRIILDKLSENNSSDDAPDENPKYKDDVMKRFRKSQLYHAAGSVREAINEYVRTKSRNSDVIHRPFSARSCAHSLVPVRISRDIRSGERKATKSEVTETSKRLHDDNQNGEDSRNTRRAKSASPEASHSRRVTEEEREEIVERLTRYDKSKWPPESPDGRRINVYA